MRFAVARQTINGQAFFMAKPLRALAMLLLFSGKKRRCHFGVGIFLWRDWKKHAIQLVISEQSSPLWRHLINKRFQDFFDFISVVRLAPAAAGAANI